MNTPRKIHLTIDALVVRGFGPEQRDAIVAGMRQDFNRLLLDESRFVRAESQTIPWVNAGSTQIESPTVPEQLGVLCAKSIGSHLAPGSV